MTTTRIAVIGAGFMGSGIAESAALAGLQVSVYEPDRAPLERSSRRLIESTERAVERGKLTPQEAENCRVKIAYTTSLDDLDGAEAVIEAVSENLDVKTALFRMLDARLPDARFLASNTSSVPIAQLASCTQRPSRVVGLHFFSPVPVMKLVEVVVSLGTDSKTAAQAEAFAAQLGKHAIRTKDRAGFVVNMLLVPYLLAAIRMFEDGFASREDIDTGMRLGCGHPMGPLTLCDFIGLDVLQAISESLYEEFRQPAYAAPPVLKRMVSLGRVGRKAGRGFYNYDEDKKVGLSA